MNSGKFSNGNTPLHKHASSCSESGNEDFLGGGNPVPNTVKTGESNPIENGNYQEDVKTLTATELKEKYPLTYDSWKNMKQRCKKGYILDQRFEKFAEFLTLMGPRRESKFTLDRLDPNNPNYGPDHCRWADKHTQNQNKGNNVYLTYKGKTMTVSAWAAESGQKANTLYHRNAKGWSDEEVITGFRKAKSNVLVINGKAVNLKLMSDEKLKEVIEYYMGWLRATFSELEEVYDRDGPDAVPPAELCAEAYERQQQLYAFREELENRTPKYQSGFERLFDC